MSTPLTSLARASAGILLLTIALVMTACASHGLTPGSPGAGDPRVDPVSSPQWATDMARFAAEDARTPPPQHPVVFTGSSSIRMWASLATDFPGVPTLNRGFGGSQMRDLVHYAVPLAIGYAPRQVVVYSGDNDLHDGRSPRQVLHDFQALITRIRNDLPHVPVLVLSIKPSPARIHELARQREANALLADAARAMHNVRFVDVSTPMLDPAGQPRAVLFGPDQLHMSTAGYALWQRIVAPHLLR